MTKSRTPAPDSRGKTVRQCKHPRTDGGSCRTPPLRSGPFCYFHEPKKAVERAAAQCRGGQANRDSRLPAAAPEFALRNAREIAEVLVWVFNQFLKGAIGTKEMYAAAFILNVMLKARDADQDEKRQEELEEAVEKPRPERGFFDRDALAEDANEFKIQEKPR
jgi:hypothetical protein